MKALLLALLLTQTLEWKHIPEASGTTAENLRVNTYVAQIARDGDNVRFWLRMDFPDGAPSGIAAFTFDSARVEARFDCKKKVMRPKSQSLFYLNGELVRTVNDKGIAKGAPATIGQHVFEAFCEEGSTPTQRPTLKP